MSDTVDVLVVDDERINLKLVEGILREFDLNLVLVESGEEALEQAQKHDFAVALLDVMMPGMDGFELAERLRKGKHTAHVPIIFITAISKGQQHVFRGYGLGAVDYLFKPVEAEVLRGKISIFADMHRYKRSLKETTKRLTRTIDALEESQKALQHSEERYRMVADYNYDWESWIDPDGSPIYVSPSCLRISGYPAETFYDDPDFFERIIHRDDVLAWHNYMADRSTGEDQAIDFRINHKNARVKWVSLIKHHIHDDEGNPLGIRTNIRDVTDRKRMEQQLKHSTLHDPLTGLPNRILFLDRVGHAIGRLAESDKMCAVLFINLNRFQAINDNYGHVVGDKMLDSVAGRLKKAVRSADTVARFGGDEFVILFDGASDKDEIREHIRTMKLCFEDPFTVTGSEFSITASFGLEFVEGPQANKDEVVHNAQLAMNHAKDRGKNGWVEYNSVMREGVVNVIAIESELKRALQAKEFEAFYQPIVNLADGSLYGLEVLARWNHPDRGLLGPGEFIPVSEETGLIVELGAYILEDACTTLNEFRKKYDIAKNLTISVNISAKQFAEATLVSEVETILERSGLPPNLLKLEITETVVMLDAMESTNRLNLLKSLGILLSIDDFGTGYSSMSYLQKFPMDQLKVDLSFVQRMEKGPENIEIVRAIINMAHSLRLRTVAEGIETEQQRDLLYSLQCDYGQGYLYSKPLSKSDTEELIMSTG